MRQVLRHIAAGILLSVVGLAAVLATSGIIVGLWTYPEAFVPVVILLWAMIYYAWTEPL